jgi:hypothetical protein
MAHVPPIARVTRRQYRYEVGPDISPALEINPGQEVVVETMDCFSGPSPTVRSVSTALQLCSGGARSQSRLRAHRSQRC